MFAVLSSHCPVCAYARGSTPVVTQAALDPVLDPALDLVLHTARDPVFGPVLDLVLDADLVLDWEFDAVHRVRRTEPVSTAPWSLASTWPAFGWIVSVIRWTPEVK